jgi:hypothetical protein
MGVAECGHRGGRTVEFPDRADRPGGRRHARPVPEVRSCVATPCTPDRPTGPCTWPGTVPGALSRRGGASFTVPARSQPRLVSADYVTLLRETGRQLPIRVRSRSLMRVLSLRGSEG